MAFRIAPRRAGAVAPATRPRPPPGRDRGARRLLGSKPILPSLQARRRRRAGAVPQVRKKRIKGRKALQEPGPRALYHSVRTRARVARASPVAMSGGPTGPPGGERCRPEPRFAGHASFSGLAQFAQPPAALELPGAWGSLRRP